MFRPKTTNRQNHHLNLHRLWPVILGAVLMSLPLVTFAQSAGQALNQSFEFFSILLTGVQAVLWPILLMMGGLMNNDLLFSGGMATILLNIWAAVRDFVNIMFVLGLLAVAIMNIMGVAKDDYSINKILPKIAIALIAVNFSFLACKVILDVVNVTTTAIYAVPMASDGLKKYSDPAQQQTLANEVCNKIMNIKGTDTSNNPYCEPATAAPPSGSSTTTAPATIYKLKTAGINFFSNFNSRNAAMVMAVELMGITNIDNVDTSQVKDPKSLTIQTLFSLIFLVIYASAFMALFCVLLVRVVVLWISIATSPLSFLGMAFGAVKKRLDKNDPFFELFMHHAIVPLPVAIVLTIGLIMITQLKQITPGVQYSTNPADLNAFASGASTLQDLIAGLATAAFVWMATFQALSNTKADFAVNWIKGTVGGVGKDLAKLPLYARIIPTGKGKDLVSLSALASGGGPLKQYMDKVRTHDAEVLGGSKAKAMAELNAADTEVKAKKAIGNTIVSSSYTVDSDAQKKIAELLEKYPNLKNKFTPPPGVTREDFLKQLKAGNVQKGPMEEFYKNNKALGFVPDNLDPTKAKTAGEGALAKAGGKADPNGKVTGTGMTELDDATTELNAALKQLKAAGDDDAKVSASIEAINKSKAKVEELTKSRDLVRGLNPASAIDKSGKVISTTGANTIKTSFESGTKSVSPAAKEGAKQALIQKFAQQLAGAGQTPTPEQLAEAKTIVDDILANGSAAKGIVGGGGPGAPGNPAAPANPGAPANPAPGNPPAP